MTGFAEAPVLWPDLHPGEQTLVTAEEAEAMLRTVLNVLDRWQLSGAEARRLLGEPSERTFSRWRAGQVAGLPADTVFRLGMLLGIHASLRTVFATPQQGYDWLRRPNTAFGGASALDRMLQGAPTALAAVRGYLDEERQGW